MTNKPLKNFKDIFQDSLKLFNRHWLTIVFFTLVIVIPSFFVFYLFFYNFALGQTIDPLVYRTLYLLLALFVSLFSLFNTAAYLKYISAALNQRPLSVISCYQEAAKSYLPYLSANITYFVKSLLWGLCLLIPGIYFAIVYNYAPILVLLEGRGRKEALAQSAAMIKPFFLKYCDYLLLAFLIAAICCIPFIIILDYLIDMAFAKLWLRAAQALDFLEIFVFLMAFQLTFLFYVVLFEELKKRYGGQTDQSS